MPFTVVIPARYASTRLPGKPLRDIAGKSLVQRVYECAVKSNATRVIIATDDARIRDAGEQFGAQVCMTSPDHKTGTDRLAEVAAQTGIQADEVIVNVQGDEPLMPASVINQVANNLLNRPQASMATVCKRIHTTRELFDPHVVKVVMDAQGYALYFSRAAIPWDRERFPLDNELPDFYEHYRHIGLYAYRAGFLQKFVAWPSCHLEQTESLEQLRALWHGEKIHVEEAVEAPGPGVDTEADLTEVTDLILSQQGL